jgi:hypothetical protein
MQQVWIDNRLYRLNGNEVEVMAQRGATVYWQRIRDEKRAALVRAKMQPKQG